MKQGNAKTRKQKERVYAACKDSANALSSFTLCKPIIQRTWAEANHSDECIPRTEIGCEVLCSGAHKAATKKRKFTPAYAAQSMFWPLQTMYGLDSDDYTVLADRCMKRRSKRASPDRKQGLQEDEKRQATKTTMVD